MTHGIDSSLGDMSMMDLFRLEAENQCNKLSEDLLALEKDPTAQDLLESLMRASHSIKGAARVVELHPAVQVAHAMEDVFVAAQENKITLDQNGIDLLLNGVDLLSSISQASDDSIDSFLHEKTAEINTLANIFTAMASGREKTPELSAGSMAEKIAEPAAPTRTEIKSIEENEPPPILPVDISDMSMLDLFRMEAENYGRILLESLAALQNNPTAADPLQSMMRAAHSMKGAAKIVGLDNAVKLSHGLETLFEGAMKGRIILGPDDMDVLHTGVAALSALAKNAEGEHDEWSADHQDELDDLLKTLALLSRKRPETKAAAPPLPAEHEPAKPEPTEEKISPPAAAKKDLKQPARRKDDKDCLRAVRVSAQSMDRMMGLAGESLVESRWLPTFALNLQQLKKRQDELHTSIDRIRENLQHKADELIVSLCRDIQDKLELCQSMLIQDIEVLDDHTRHATSISHRLYQEIITSKMRPFSEGTRGFARMVRDVARELGKEVNFEIIGSDSLVDLDILDKIEAPLNHMIRNALDHGIEPPEERIALGKPRAGEIKLEARHTAGILSITVRDDGRGVDLKKLRQVIIGKNLCGPEIAEDLSEAELLEFLFLPNFSTKDSVSKVSGRGVGMDVVHSVINEVRGKIRSSTKLHEGSSFELQLPLTLSVLRALLTEINSELYAFPLVSIDHVLQLTPEQIHEVEGRQYFISNEKRIGIVSAQQVFRTETPTEKNSDFIYVIVFSDRLNLYGLTVDKLLGVRDLVVQPLAPRLGKIKDINSASILEDDTPILIIDVEDVFRSLDQLISGDRLIRIGHEDEQDVRPKRVLVADDSITVRELERQMLTAEGYEVDVAVDGVDAWNNVRAKNYDLIITDIDMPRMNGFELVSMIKNNPNLRNIPVIVVSYKDREEDRRRGLDAGADYYLTKGSFHDRALINAVFDLIGEAGE